MITNNKIILISYNVNGNYVIYKNFVIQNLFNAYLLNRKTFSAALPITQIPLIWGYLAIIA